MPFGAEGAGVKERPLGGDAARIHEHTIHHIVEGADHNLSAGWGD